MKLNVGCGRDEWGDVRLDAARTYRGRDISPNFIGDAQNLPFRDSVFSEVKASHIIEEVPHWKKALFEWARVCNNILDIRFPIADGFKRPFLIGLLNLKISSMKSAAICRKQRCHYWIINPKIVSDILKKSEFEVEVILRKRPLLSGRKGKLLCRLTPKGTIRSEYQIIATKKGKRADLT